MDITENRKSDDRGDWEREFRRDEADMLARQDFDDWDFEEDPDML